MTLYDSFILGIVQGLLEFLPVSSSGHLVLMEHYLKLSINPVTLQNFDIALHAGSLLALFLYFGKIWISLCVHPLRKQPQGDPSLLLMLAIASIPVAVAGFAGADWIGENTRTPLFVAFGFIFTGAFLIVSSWFESRFAATERFGWKQVLGAGIGQVIAVFPGFSRSGLTLASGRLMGLTATSATELSFLLGTPALFGAILYAFMSDAVGLLAVGKLQLLIGFVTSFITSIAVIHLFLKTVRTYGVWIWAAYLFLAATLIISDEMLPLVAELPKIIENMDARVIVGVVFIALLLESTPFTSFFVPGFATLVVVSLFFRDDPKNLFALVPIGTAGLVLGHLLGYIPARQARLIIRWREKADERLTRAQHFFHKWGIYAVFFGGWWAPFRPWISIAAGMSNMRPLPYMLTMIASSIIYVSTVIAVTALSGNAIL